MKHFVLLLIVTVFYCSAACSSSNRIISSQASVPENCEIASLIPIAWKEDSNGCKGDRGRLLDLIDSINLEGYSRECIYFALGEPDYISRDSIVIEYAVHDSCDASFWGDKMWYSITFENGISEDSGLWGE